MSLIDIYLQVVKIFLKEPTLIPIVEIFNNTKSEGSESILTVFNFKKL